MCLPRQVPHQRCALLLLQIVKKVELEAQRAKGPNEAKGGRRRRNPVEDLKREVSIMRTLRHKNIVSLQVNILSAVLSCLRLPACLCLHTSEILSLQIRFLVAVHACLILPA